MSCWVVPTVAAELWNVTVAVVLEKARLGLVPQKVENGFTFVDVAASSENCARPPALRGQHPPTFTALSDAELQALTNSDELPAESLALQSGPNDDWRSARLLTSRTRKPPRVATQTV